jgi:hypothetical protein
MPGVVEPAFDGSIPVDRRETSPRAARRGASPLVPSPAAVTVTRGRSPHGTGRTQPRRKGPTGRSLTSWLGPGPCAGQRAAQCGAPCGSDPQLRKTGASAVGQGCFQASEQSFNRRCCRTVRDYLVVGVTNRDVEPRDHICASASQKFGELELRDRTAVRVRRSTHQGTHLAPKRPRRYADPEPVDDILHVARHTSIELGGSRTTPPRPRRLGIAAARQPKASDRQGRRSVEGAPRPGATDPASVAAEMPAQQPLRVPDSANPCAGCRTEQRRPDP